MLIAELINSKLRYYTRVDGLMCNLADFVSLTFGGSKEQIVKSINLTQIWYKMLVLTKVPPLILFEKAAVVLPLKR